MPWQVAVRSGDTSKVVLGRLHLALEKWLSFDALQAVAAVQGALLAQAAATPQVCSRPITRLKRRNQQAATCAGQVA